MLRTDISNSAYHGSGDLSRSKAWSLITSCPAKVYHEMKNPPDGDAKHFVIGGCTHTATLEPFKLEEEYAVKPKEIDGRGPLTKDYKAAFSLMQDHAPEKRWLTPSDYKNCMEMAASAREHPLLQTYLDDPATIIEGTGYFTHRGAECKVRPDLFNPGAGVVIDLKTTQEGDLHGFSKSVRRYGYSFQSCWYLTGLQKMGYNPKEFIFLCVEKSAPFLTSAYAIPASEIERQKPNMSKACNIWNECMKTGVWPGYPDEVQTLSLGGNLQNNRLSISDIASKFNISRAFVYKVMKEMEITTQTFGRKRTIDITEFANAMQKRAVA